MRMLVALTCCCLAAAAEDPRLKDLTDAWETPRETILSGFHNLYNPQVLEVPDEDHPYRMFFFGYSAEEGNPDYPGGDAIFAGRSKDLHRWEIWCGEKSGWAFDAPAAEYVPILTPDPQAYDNMAAGDPSVVYRDGRYYMAYSGVRFDTRADETGKERLYLMDCVMGAVSDDGLEWRRSEKPLLQWELAYDVPWEIVDGKIPTEPPAEFYGRYHRPSLMWDEGKWRLWFDYFHPGTFVSMGYAENTGDFLDGESWQVLRAGKEPLLKDWPNVSVVRVLDRYYAFADPPGHPEAHGGDTRQITVAVSKDGVDWEIKGHLRPEGLASSHVPEAVVLHQGRGCWLYVFYSWKPARQPGEEWDFRYKELRYMRLPLPQEACKEQGEEPAR